MARFSQSKTQPAQVVAVVVRVLEYDMWEIVIIMFLALSDTQDAAIRVTHNEGEVLEFETKEICLQHVWANVDKLKEFGSSQYDGAPVKEIGCWLKPDET